MQKPLLRDFTPGMKILFFFFLWILTMMLVSAFGASVVNALYGIDLSDLDLEKVGTDEEWLYQEAFWVLTMIRMLGIYALTAITFLELTEKEPFKFLRLRRTGITKNTLLVLILGISAVFGSMWVQIGTQWVLDLFGGFRENLDEISSETQRMSDILLTGGWRKGLINILLLGVIVPVCEELLFRGALQTYLIKVSLKVFHGVLITAFVFALIHAEFDGFLVRFGMGMALGFVFIWSGNLWGSILLHGVYNTTQVVLIYLNREGQLNEEVVKIMPAIGLLIAGTAVYLLYRFRTTGPSDWLSK